MQKRILLFLLILSQRMAAQNAGIGTTTPGYTNSTAAKWLIFFPAGREGVICSIKMKNKCTVETPRYPLTVGVRLFNR